MSQPTRFVSLIGCALTCFLCATGCAKKLVNASSEERILVLGKVVLSNGQPVTAGSITFNPDDPSQGPAIVCPLQEAGAFKLVGSEGASTGFYTVYLVPSTPPSSKSNYFRSVVPEKYLDPEASPLRIEIKPGEVNEFTFNLE